MPRPPDTMTLASVSSILPLVSLAISATLVFSWAASSAGSNFSAAPAFAFSTMGNTLGRSVAIAGDVSKATSPKHLPAYRGRTATSLPPSIFRAVQSVASPVASLPTSLAERSLPCTEAPISRMAGCFSFTIFATAAAWASVV